MTEPTQPDNVVALIDLDGTVADYDRALREHMVEIKSPGEILPADFWKDTDPYIEARMSLIKRQPGFWRSLPIIPIGLQVYSLLGAMGFMRMVLTKGPKRNTAAWTEKVEWALRWLPDAGIAIVHSDDGPHKGLLYGKVLFDDWPPYILQWLKHRPRGKVLMLDSPYNRNFEHPNVLRIARESDLTLEQEKKIVTFLLGPGAAQEANG